MRHPVIEPSSCRTVEQSSRQLSRRLTVKQWSRQAVEALNHQAAELVSRQLGGPTHQRILRKISAYVAAHGTTHHAAHGTRDCQGLPALFGLAAEEIFQGKTGQRGSATNFSLAQRQHKKKAAIAHGIRGGRRDHQRLPVLPAFV